MLSVRHSIGSFLSYFWRFWVTKDNGDELMLIKICKKKLQPKINVVQIDLRKIGKILRIGGKGENRMSYQLWRFGTKGFKGPLGWAAFCQEIEKNKTSSLGKIKTRWYTAKVQFQTDGWQKWTRSWKKNQRSESLAEIWSKSRISVHSAKKSWNTD